MNLLIKDIIQKFQKSPFVLQQEISNRQVDLLTSEEEGKLDQLFSLDTLGVVYFDQRMHACACLCNVHAFAWSKTIENALKLSKTYFFHHAYQRLI